MKSRISRRLPVRVVLSTGAMAPRYAARPFIANTCSIWPLTGNVCSWLAGPEQAFGTNGPVATMAPGPHHPGTHHPGTHDQGAAVAAVAYPRYLSPQPAPAALDRRRAPAGRQVVTTDRMPARVYLRRRLVALLLLALAVMALIRVGAVLAGGGPLSAPGR